MSCRSAREKRGRTRTSPTCWSTWRCRWRSRTRRKSNRAARSDPAIGIDPAVDAKLTELEKESREIEQQRAAALQELDDAYDDDSDAALDSDEERGRKRTEGDDGGRRKKNDHRIPHNTSNHSNLQTSGGLIAGAGSEGNEEEHVHLRPSHYPAGGIAITVSSSGGK